MKSHETKEECTRTPRAWQKSTQEMDSKDRNEARQHSGCSATTSVMKKRKLQVVSHDPSSRAVRAAKSQ